MGDQIGRGNFDQGARRGNASDRGARDAFGKEPRDEFIRKTPELFRIKRAADDHIGHTISPRAAPDVRIVRILWQRGNRIHRGLHIIRCTRHVPTGLKVHSDRGAPFC